MAKISLNPMVQHAGGRIGNAVLRRTHGGNMSLIKLADMSNVKWSKAQQAHRQRFKEAVAYARVAMAEPKTRLAYEKAALKARKRPFDLAVSDFFKGVNLLRGERK